MNWFKEMLSGSDGITSSKRVVMFLFTLTFIGLTIANFCTGKRSIVLPFGMVNINGIWGTDCGYF
jgi:hypothetical protein